MKRYHYSDGQKSFGPVGLEELRSLNIKANTLIWTEDLITWIPAKDVAELKDLFPIEETSRKLTSPSFDTPPSLSQQTDTLRPPKTYLVEAIITTIVCCWLIGIPSIVYASRVEKKFYAGDIIGAQSDSANAKKWVIINIIACASLWIIYLGFFGLGLLGLFF